MTQAAIELIGLKGYTHGWDYHGPGSGTRARTSRLVSRDVRSAQGKLKNASPTLAANRATAALRGKRGSDYQHLAAARLHAAAAKQTSGPIAARHLQMARMHRGIAGRNVGRQTRSEGPLRPPGGKAKSMARPTGKESESAAGRRTLAGQRLALPDGSFPVGDAAHWDKAFRAVGRAGTPAKRAALKALLLRTAKQYGKQGKVQGSWLTAANDRSGVELAAQPYSRHPGEDVQCPSCGKYNMDDARYCDQCGTRLPESAFEHANDQGALEMATHLAITGPYDLLITRSATGEAIVRHRRGGDEIGRIKHSDDGQWRAARDGKDLAPHARQRGALLELIGTHNRSASTPYHRAAPAKPEKAASPLADALGIPQLDVAAASELANTTPAVGAGDGPRVTGLGKGGDRIYKQLRKRGFPHARAQAFASRAQRRMGGSK